jgi:hypothetical protein
MKRSGVSSGEREGDESAPARQSRSSMPFVGAIHHASRLHFAGAAASSFAAGLCASRFRLGEASRSLGVRP